MHKIISDVYSLDIFVDHAYSLNDSVNKYDFIYFEAPAAHIIGIKLNESDEITKSAVIGAWGGGASVHSSSLVLEAERLVICCSDTIFCLSMPDLFLLWKTQADIATCFQIFKYQEDYIVHGELEISRLANNGEILWQQGGEDIFTTVSVSQNDFFITNKYILATDWNKRQYKFDFDGNVIQE